MNTDVVTPPVSGRGFGNRPQAGFSMPEILVVVLIGLIITVVALPSMVNVIGAARVRGNISTLSGIFQNCRILAVKNNRTMTTHFNVATNGIMAYVKLATDSSAPTSTDTQVELEAPVTRYTDPLANGGPAGITTTTLGFTGATGDASFNSRGLPCAYASGTCTNQGFIYYFKVTRRNNNDAWAAVSISPAGRIKKWFWDGTSWAD